MANGTAGRLDDAERTAEQALALFERTDDGPGRAAAVIQLGYVAADRGRLEQARELQEQALALWRGFIPMSGWCSTILLELAELDAALGEHGRVPERLAAAMATYAHAGDKGGVAYCEAALRAASNGVLTAE
jgi:tetratricopeptide (TPR) repeat protein